MKQVNQILVTVLLISLLSSLLEIQGQIDLGYKQYNIDISRNINNIKTINLSIIGTELSYIPLETTSECLLREVLKIEISDLYIFVNGVSKLLQFDRNGRFIRQIGSQGRGPGEYLSVADFCIDKELKEIYIISAPHLLVFDFNGDLKESVKLSFRPAQIILIDKDHLMYHLYNVPGQYSMTDSWIITDKQGRIIYRYKNSIKRISQPGLIIPRTPLYVFENTAHFMEFGVDTLYSFYQAKKMPYVICNFGDLKMDPDPLITPESREMINKKLFKKIYISSIYENEDYFFIKFYQGLTDSVRFAIYDKERADLVFLIDNAFINDLDGGLLFKPQQVINDSILVDFEDAFDLLRRIKTIKSNLSTIKRRKIPEALSNIENSITESSNPVLIFLE